MGRARVVSTSGTAGPPGAAEPLARVRRVEDLSGLMGERGRTVVVCFSGSWCGSCSLFEPTFEAVAGELADPGRVFALVDTQELPAWRRPTPSRPCPPWWCCGTGWWSTGSTGW
ncbi:hypothetical protein BJF82_07305 [Kytococcus sp. CUA-901]|nr:hypothetical protein BJF82_07305 [Kytococcus sp. CUA-901]